MSIHNIKEVTETESHEARNRTRDRFGKTHALSNEDGSTRLPLRSKALVLAVLFGSMFQAEGFSEEAMKTARRNTDIQVASEELDENSWLDKELNKPEDRFGIPLSESTAIGFNDDGDPSVGMRY